MVVLPVLTSALVSAVSTVVSHHQLSSALRLAWTKLHALHSACLSHVWLRHRPPSKNNRNVLKISYIKGKYLVNRYLPLVFCAYSACSKCRIRGQNQERVSQKSGACFPSHSFVSQKKEELLVPTPREGGLKLPPITTILLFSFVISINHFIIVYHTDLPVF